jgi:hypothetical protein
MKVLNTLAYYDMTTITAVKGFIVQSETSADIKLTFLLSLFHRHNRQI